MRRVTTAAVALATTSALTITALGGAFGGAQATTSAHDRSSSKARYVDFALKGAGFGSRATGGQVPTGSGQTAFMAIGCATRTGIKKENHEAEVTIPGLGKASGVRTDIWTDKVGDAISTYTQNTTGKVVVAQSGFGSVAIKAISSFAHAWHDTKGFHSEAKTSIGSIVYTPTVGDPQEFDIPTPGQPIEIPGLVKISLGTTKKHANADGALAQANALVVSKTVSGTRAKVSQARALVLNGVKHGTFHGFSAATEAEAADGNITSGRTPLSLMPCQGTDGVTKTKSISDTDLGGNVLATGLQTQQMGKQMPGKSVAFQRATVAHLDLGGGQLDVEGIVGQVHVTRDGGKVVADTKGSKVGTITANGQEQEFPDTGVIEIPGLVKIERFVTEKSRFGMSIIALRITLLDGTGAVLNLGQASMMIRPH